MKNPEQRNELIHMKKTGIRLAVLLGLLAALGLYWILSPRRQLHYLLKHRLL